MSTATRQIMWNTTHVFGFDIDQEGPDVRHVHDFKQNKALSGLIETISLGSYQELNVPVIFRSSDHRKGIAWWSWARQGKAFRFEMDSTACASTSLSSSAVASSSKLSIPNNILNGTFAGTSEWTVTSTNWTISSGVAKADGGMSTGENIYQLNALRVGMRYRVHYTLKPSSSGGLSGKVRPYCGAYGAGTWTSSTGTHVQHLRAVDNNVSTANIRCEFYIMSNSSFDGAIDDISVIADFSTNDEILIKAKDNDDEFEVAKVAAVTAGSSPSLTLDRKLIYNYPSSSIVRHRNFWPSVVNTAAQFNPKPLTSHADLYRTTLTFRESS